MLPQCLEADFYSWVAYGEGIATVDASLVGTLSSFAGSIAGL